MGIDPQTTAQRLRQLVEPVAAGVYFAPEAQQRYEACGLNYFEGYFCSRSACLGKLPWRAVCGIFAVFKPAVVERAVTGGWKKTEPEDLLEARLEGAREQLARLVGDVPAEAVRAADILLDLTEEADPAGRPLFAGLRSLPVPDRDDPLGRLWRAADRVREHRGDGHIATWISTLDSIEVSVLTEPWWGIAPGSYVWTRGWSEEEIAEARLRLQERGLLTESGELSLAGEELREDIEHRTDLADRRVIERLGGRTDELFDLLQPMARAIVTGGGYPADPSRMFG